MNQLPKETRKINTILGRRAIYQNLINKSMNRNYRIKSKDNIYQKEENDINLFKEKNNPIEKTFNDDIRKNQFKIYNNQMNLFPGSLTCKNTRNIQNKIISSEQESDIKKIMLTYSLFEDIKIRNIISLWNELEVMDSYKKYFFFIYKEIDEEDKQILYQNEINELIQLKNDIKSLTYNMELRVGILKRLTELNDELNLRKKEDVNGAIIDEMIKKLEDLCIQTVNIVKYMKKIKTIINLAPNLGKYDINVISKKFNFDKNYIIKMKLETNFLREGNAKYFFNIKNDQTPFFIKANDKMSISNENTNTYSISLDSKVIDDIKECNYYIYKELIDYENDKIKRKIYRCISPIRKNTSAYNFYKNINFYSQKNKNQENNKNKLLFNLKTNGKKILIKKNDNLFTNKSDKNPIKNIKMNEYSKILQNFELFNYKRQLNKNSDFINFQSEYNKNKILNKNQNRSEILSLKLIESKSNPKLSDFNEVNFSQKRENHSIENIGNNENPKT